MLSSITADSFIDRGLACNSLTLSLSLCLSLPPLLAFCLSPIPPSLYSSLLGRSPYLPLTHSLLVSSDISLYPPLSPPPSLPLICCSSSPARISDTHTLTQTHIQSQTCTSWSMYSYDNRPSVALVHPAGQPLHSSSVFVGGDSTIRQGCQVPTSSYPPPPAEAAPEEPGPVPVAPLLTAKAAGSASGRKVKRN